MNQNDFLYQNRRIETVVLGDWLGKARKLISILSEEPTSSINTIIGFALNKPAYFGISNPEFVLSTAEETMLDSLLSRLLSGEPLPYITGEQEFFGFDFKVTSDVLIPRPETEMLVEYALGWLQKRGGRNLVADVGTGSGCIAVSIGNNLPTAKIIGTDFSNNALQISRVNIKRHELDGQINLVQTDLLAGLQVQFDCICANLPYIPSDTLSELSVRKFEPISALDGGRDGLRHIKPLLYQSKTRVKPDGLILLEIEATQSHSVIDLAATVFPAASIRIHFDLSGLPRLIQVQMNGE